MQSKSRGRLSCMLVLPSWESGCVRTLAMCFAGVVFVVKAAVVIAVVLAAVVIAAVVLAAVVLAAVVIAAVFVVTTAKGRDEACGSGGTLKHESS